MSVKRLDILFLVVWSVAGIAHILTDYALLGLLTGTLALVTMLFRISGMLLDRQFRDTVLLFYFNEGMPFFWHVLVTQGFFVLLAAWRGMALEIVFILVSIALDCVFLNQAHKLKQEREAHLPPRTNL